MALKVAPEQGWGLHWNEAHPDQPFTPVEVGPPPYTSAAASPQATPVISAPAAAPQATPVISAPAAVPQAATEHASAPITTPSVSAPSGSTLQGVAVPSVVTELFMPAGLQGGGAQPGAASTLAASDASDGSIAPLTLAANWSDGWFIVPSAANEYGQAYAAGDGFVWDVASGEFTADWFFVV